VTWSKDRCSHLERHWNLWCSGGARMFAARRARPKPFQHDRCLIRRPAESAVECTGPDQRICEVRRPDGSLSQEHVRSIVWVYPGMPTTDREVGGPSPSGSQTRPSPAEIRVAAFVVPLSAGTSVAWDRGNPMVASSPSAQLGGRPPPAPRRKASALGDSLSVDGGAATRRCPPRQPARRRTGELRYRLPSRSPSSGDGRTEARVMRPPSGTAITDGTALR
jgi:hypothetical protein